MLYPIRIPVTITTDSTGAGSAQATVSMAYAASVTFSASTLGGAAPAWVITGTALPLAVGAGNLFQAGPLTVYAGELITISVTGAAPNISIQCTLVGSYSTVGVSELPPQTLAVSGVTNSQAGGLQRLSFLVAAQDNTTVNIIIPGVAGQRIRLYHVVWSFSPWDNASPFGTTPPPVAMYAAGLQSDAGGGSYIDYMAYQVASAVGGLSSPTRDLELWNHPEVVGNVGSGLIGRMAGPAIATVPTAGIWMTGHLIYTQQ